MAKILFFVLIVAVVYFFILPKFRKKEKKDEFVECKMCRTFVDASKTSGGICSECKKLERR